MNNYQTPELTLFSLHSADILTASGTQGFVGEEHSFLMREEAEGETL